jgi:hypothetical protein
MYNTYTVQYTDTAPFFVKILKKVGDVEALLKCRKKCQKTSKLVQRKKLASKKFFLEYPKFWMFFSFFPQASKNLDVFLDA